jgi:outer membrane protein OmpA-like peptidoglycan-associated protein
MAAVTTRPLAIVLCAVLVVAGCTSADSDQPGQQTTTTSASPSASLRSECRDVADDARALLTEVGRLATRDATVDDVRTAASALATSFDDAKSALGPGARAQLDQAGQALQRVQDALSTQPVNTAELRRAARDVVAALGDAAAVCSGSSSTTGTPTS